MAGRKSNEQLAREAEARRVEIAEAVKAALDAHKAELRAEVKAEIVAEVAEASVQQTDGAVQGILPLQKPATPEGDKGFASALALAIANLSAQGTGKAAYISPEELEKFENHRKRMTDLMIQARAEGNVPTYRVKNFVYFNETRIQPQWHDPVSKAMKDTEIYWDEVPNEELEPTNEIATAIFAEFMASIGQTVIEDERPARPWVRTDKRLFQGMTSEQRESVYGKANIDPRIEGKGAPTSGKRVHLMGTVAAPAVVR